jgi:DNA-binding response OmpR family regulator
MQDTMILWADDEIDLLKPHILFLNEKGYQVKTVTNGADAIDLIKTNYFDLVFLDENMPGLTGLETLVEIKNFNSEIPVVLITKNEEEYLMEEAIGKKIADYLIKPVNPKQILLTIKKILDNKRLITEKTASAYQQEFRNLGSQLNDVQNIEEWMDAYRKLVYWELALEQLEDAGMHEILTLQKSEANALFSKFVEKNYLSWLQQPDKAPMLSHSVLRKKVFPNLSETQPTFFILIDNLRYDQWKIIAPLVNEYFRLEEEELYVSILPTATQYARNAVFSGMLPNEMEKRFPKLWKNDEDEGGKNLHEEEFLIDHLQRARKEIKSSYHKITTNEQGKDLAENVHHLFKNNLNVIVYNFVDMLSHARTEMDMIKELAPDESAYRSLTYSWFEHSPLLEIIKKIAQKNARLVITTDHGTIRVKTPSKVIGDRSVNSNLRYKQGKNLNYVAKDVFEIKNPADAFLPKVNMSQTYIFAKNDTYFVYQNNYNHFANFFANSFQHGGISLEEMLIPYASYTSKV